jgi:germination protein M
MMYLTSSSRFFVILAVLLASLVVLAACNGNDGEDEITDDVAAPAEEVADDDTDESPTPMPVETPVSADATADDSEDDAAQEQDDHDPAQQEEAEATPEQQVEPTPVPDHEEVDDETGASPRSVLVYLARNEEIAAVSRDIAGTPEVAMGAMNELLTGTTPYEEDLGFTSEVPFETRLLGLTIQDDGIAVVNLSPEFETGGGSLSMQMRVAQIVFTLTQFSAVDQVQFQIDGQPVEAIGGEGVMVDQPQTRADFEDISPAILLESPAPGAVVSSPIELRGTSNTFEATMQIEIIDSAGEIIYQDFATATAGSGTRGTFDVTIDLDIQNEGLGTIVLYEKSAQDGSRINVVETPVDFRR